MNRMVLDHYKQYLDGWFVITAYNIDSYDTAEDFLEDACDTLFNDDFYDMRFSITDIDTGDGDFGDCVRLCGCERNMRVRSRRFCDNYMRAFNGGFPDWVPVRIAVGPESMKLYFFRFGGENGLCDEYEVLEIRYPDYIRLETEINRDGTGSTRYVISAKNLPDMYPEVVIKEYDGDTLSCTRRIHKDHGGVYAEVDESGETSME